MLCLYNYYDEIIGVTEDIMWERTRQIIAAREQALQDRIDDEGCGAFFAAARVLYAPQV